MQLKCLLVVLAVVSVTDADWVQIWSDEFNDAAGTAPDSSKWGYDIGDGGDGWGNGELEYYTDSRVNSATDGEGNLAITATTEGASDHQCYYGTCQYTSARLVSENKFTHTYGRFEARMLLPKGQGCWPAFWLLGSNFGDVGWPACGEIDIMEVKGSECNKVLGSIHGPGYTGSTGIMGYYVLPYGDYNNGWHVFALEWSADAITFYSDDTAYFTQTPADVEANGWQWVFDHDFFIILNFAVGGNFDGNPGPDTPFPQSMLVDYVRVYEWQ